nr:hypothetical protein [uncultured Hyphomonas sp.]
MNKLILLSGLAFLGACASSGAPPEADVPTGASTAATASLPAQTLEPGTCGLFLWTRDEPRHFVLFFGAGDTTAKAIMNGRQQTLRVDSQDGDVFGQFLTRMAFSAPDGDDITLTMTPGEQIEGGRRVPLARMIYDNEEGWEIITPLTGLTACQPE